MTAKKRKCTGEKRCRNMFCWVLQNAKLSYCGKTQTSMTSAVWIKTITRSESKLETYFWGNQLLFQKLEAVPVFIFSLSVSSFAGTTCLVALLSDRELTVANVGDSRGVLCDKDGNAVALSHDHKPYQLKERKRIKRAGKREKNSSTTGM